MRCDTARQMISSMSAQHAPSRATTVALVVLAAIVLNVVPRVVGLPDVELPAISLPDPPGWVDPAGDAIRALVRVKNVVLVGVVVAIVVSAAARRPRSPASSADE